MNDFRGRTALVTGAGTEVGRAIAVELAERGANLILLGLNAHFLEATRVAIAARGGQAYGIAVDLADPARLDRLDELAADIDVLVLGATSLPGVAMLSEPARAEIRPALESSLRAARELSAHLLPGMKQRGFGRIVLLGSLAGACGVEGGADISATCAGFGTLMRATALEGAKHGVTANLVELGPVDTERVREVAGDEALDRIVKCTPVGRLARAEEVAAGVAFLASPRASYITGAALPLNGGLGLGLYPEQLG